MPFGEDIDGWTKHSRSIIQRVRSSVGEGGKEEERDFQWDLLLWPMFHHIQYFISGFDKDREAHQTTQQMTQNRENAQDSKTQNKRKHTSVDSNFKLTQWNI